MEESPVIYPGKYAKVGSEWFTYPMHVAIIKGDVEAIASMHKFREKIDQEENGPTPLHLAVIKGQILAARILISLRANVNKMNKDGSTPLHLAAFHDRAFIIEDLININTESDIDIFDRNGNTALHIAVKMGNIAAVRELLKEGANADLPNRQGNAALHLAVVQGNLGVISVVIKYVRKPNILDKNKFRPLHLAVLHNQIGAIPIIGKMKDSNIDNRNGDGDGPLHLAVKLRNLEAIKALLDLNVNVNLKNSRGFPPMHLAVKYHEMNTTQILAQIVKNNRFKNALIHVAEAQKIITLLRLLYCPRTNVNIKDMYGDSILHSVIMTDCKDAVKMLLDAGAKHNVHNGMGSMTPLHAAVCFGNKDIIEMLLRYGADIHSCDRDGDTPLHSAANYCNSVGIETMIKHGGDINKKNRRDLTPVDIIMLHVRENTFGSAVQTLTNLYNLRHLTRKYPLNSHEILKSAKLIFKFEIWKNFEVSILSEPEHLSNIISMLRSYIDDCFAEIRLMKSTFLHENFTFYKFVKNGWDNTRPLTRAYASEVALHHILNVSITKGYPIYRDAVVSNLERSSLLKSVICLKIPVKYNGKTTFMDLDDIFKYLVNDDILNFLLAFSDLDPDNDSKSSDGKKRKLEEF